MTFNQLNAIAAADGLELNYGGGYFFWWGTTEAMKLKTAGLYTTSVEVQRFLDLTAAQWLESLASIKKQISAGEEKEDTNL